jgi:hypothetical protein
MSANPAPFSQRALDVRRRERRMRTIVILLWSAAVCSPLAHFSPTEVVIFVAVVLPMWGWALPPLIFAFLLTIARPKPVCLFLRRFGPHEHTEAMRDAFRRELGKRYRLVTLDDSVFVPLRLPGRETALSGTAFAMTLLASVGLFAAALLYFAMQFQPTITGWPGLVMVQGMLMFGLPVLIFTSWVCGVSLAFFVVHAMRTSRRSRAVVREEDDIARLASDVARMRKRTRRSLLAAPRSIVVTVRDSLWQATVDSLIGGSDAVIIDTTEMTENIQWEIARVEAQSPEKLIRIACRPSSDAEFAYAIPRSRADRKTLARNLDAVIANAAAAGGRTTPPKTRVTFRDVARFVFAYGSATVIATLIGWGGWEGLFAWIRTLR